MVLPGRCFLGLFVRGVHRIEESLLFDVLHLDTFGTSLHRIERLSSFDVSETGRFPIHYIKLAQSFHLMYPKQFQTLPGICSIHQVRKKL